MFDTLLIITLFLLASLLVCLLTLRLSINIKHLRLFFHSLPILTDFLKFRPPWFYQDFKSGNMYFLNLYSVHAARTLDLSLEIMLSPPK